MNNKFIYFRNKMDKIRLNVGGVYVETLKSTLLRLKYMENMLKFYIGDSKEDSSNNEKLSGEIFIDADYEIFRHILNKARYNNYILENENIINMWNYYNCLNDVKDKEKEKEISKKNIKIIKTYTDKEKIYLNFSSEKTETEITEIYIRIKSLSINNFKFRITDTSINNRYILKCGADTLYLFFDLEADIDSFKTYKLKSKYRELLNELKYLENSTQGIIIGLDFNYNNSEIVVTCIETNKQ